MRLSIVFMQAMFIAMVLYPLIDGKNNPGTYMVVGMICGGLLGAYSGAKQANQDQKSDEESEQ